MRTLALLAVLMLSDPAAAQPNDREGKAGPSWSRYGNERFGTQVDVPLFLFEDIPASSRNGDGRAFATRDGRAEMRVSATRAALAGAGSLAGYRRIVAENEPSMSYRAGGRGWFVLSGRSRGEIRYTKVVEGCGAAHAVFLRYPASQKRFYDPIVTRISASLAARCPRA